MTTDQNVSANDQNVSANDRGLTPADLQNVQFTRASMLRPGYVDTEVDRVLSRVAEELGRLYAEKAAMRDQVRSLQAQVDGVVIPEAPSEQAVRILSSAQQTADNYVAEAEEFSRQVCVAGPAVMVEDTVSRLVQSGVPTQRISSEVFAPSRPGPSVDGEVTE